MARYTELENKHIQLELDLKLVQENFTKAKEEAKGMFGENLDDRPYFLSDHPLGCDCFEIVCLFVPIQAESLH